MSLSEILLRTRRWTTVICYIISYQVSINNLMILLAQIATPLKGRLLFLNNQKQQNALSMKIVFDLSSMSDYLIWNWKTDATSKIYLNVYNVYFSCRTVPNLVFLL